MRGTWRVALVILASVTLAGAPGFAAAQSENRSDQVSNGAKDAKETTETAEGKTAGTTGSGQGGRDVGDRLHDSAKGFGEALLGGIKHAGRTVIDFFSDDEKPRK